MGYFVQNDRVTVKGELERAWTRLTSFKIHFQQLPEEKKTVAIQMKVRLRFERGTSQIQISQRQLSRFVAS
jgi:hypothetical protein